MQIRRDWHQKHSPFDGQSAPTAERHGWPVCIWGWGLVDLGLVWVFSFVNLNLEK